MLMLVYLIAMVNGFCMMSFEMTASKMIAPYFGNSMHVWGSIISVFMLSLACGALTGGWYSKVSLNQTKLVSFMLLMVASMLYVRFASDLLIEIIMSTSLSNNVKLLGVSMALFAPFSFFSGMITPYSIGLLTSSAQDAGAVTGRVYFVSTLASVVGTLLTSFYFVVWFQIETIIFINIVLILAMIFVFLVLKVWGASPLFISSESYLKGA